jgi:hypothetical protein
VVQNQYPCKDVVAIDEEPHHRRVMANEFARVFLVEIAPHERTLCHHHAHDYLMYVAGDAQIVSAPRDGEPKTQSYHDGDCELSSAGLIHVVENLRETKFRNLLVELLPRLDELRRGGDPRIVAGNGTVEAIFQEGRISVWPVEMDLDGQAEVHGPAIVATLDADSVMDISWIPAVRGLLRCDRLLRRPLRAILFQLGRTEERLAAVLERTDEPIKSLRAHADEPE